MKKQEIFKKFKINKKDQELINFALSKLSEGAHCEGSHIFAKTINKFLQEENIKRSTYYKRLSKDSTYLQKELEEYFSRK